MDIYDYSIHKRVSWFSTPSHPRIALSKNMMIQFCLYCHWIMIPTTFSSPIERTESFYSISPLIPSSFIISNLLRYDSFSYCERIERDLLCLYNSSFYVLFGCLWAIALCLFLYLHISCVSGDFFIAIQTEQSNYSKGKCSFCSIHQHRLMCYAPDPPINTLSSLLLAILNI